jgi:hypothetical protein
VSELSKTAGKVAFRSANDALWRDIRYAELVDALRALRGATAALLTKLDPTDRAIAEAAIAQADRALADSEPRPK